MDLSGIISISGKPGLFKVVAQAKNNIIVESLVDGKRVPAYSTDKISALEDISIYTYEEDKPLAEVYQAIYEKEIDSMTVARGLKWQMYDWSYYALFQSKASESYKLFKQKTYLKPKEILEQMQKEELQIEK
jgi:hypothetical protein